MAVVDFVGWSEDARVADDERRQRRRGAHGFRQLPMFVQFDAFRVGLLPSRMAAALLGLSNHSQHPLHPVHRVLLVSA